MKSSKNEPGFDAFDDIRQAGMRLEVLRYLTLAIFLILGARLWWLQVMNHEIYAEQSEQNRTRELLIPARRGTIYDRNGKVLVDSRSSYNIVLSRREVRNFAQMTDLLVDNLGIERTWLEKRFKDAQSEPQYESIVVKELATPQDIAWVMAHEYEHPELRAEEAPQRHYLYGAFAAHALGYVGEVSPEELKKGAFSKENGYKLGDIIGKSGIERTYNHILMGKDGKRRVIVDSRGRIQMEIERIEPVSGRDLYTTLDFDVQKAAEEAGDRMEKGRGVVIAMNPQNGEVLAMVSRPAFDPNIFSQRIKTPEGKEEIRDLKLDEDKPLYNRAIQGIFPPGSTWKMLMATAGLSEGAITLENSKLPDGGLQIGNYFMKSLSHLGYPDIHLALVKSADGYFYRLGLKLGIEKMEKWVQVFQIGRRTGIDLPSESAGIPPTREMRARINPRDPKWTDYNTAAAAIGQGFAITPLQLLRYVSALSVNGQMTTPHLLLKAVAGIDYQGNWHDEVRYEDRNNSRLPIAPEIIAKVNRGMWGVVNEAGTGAGTRLEGFEIAGKTGTAQVASTHRVGTENKDHAWFVSFAPFEKPEIAMVVLTENVGFGSTYSVPKARAVYEDYYRRTRHLDETKAEEVALKR
jgi:penicillin-binding protein 2